MHHPLARLLTINIAVPFHVILMQLKNLTLYDPEQNLASQTTAIRGSAPSCLTHTASSKI